MSQLVAPALGVPSLGKSNSSKSIGSRSPASALSHLGTPQANLLHVGTSGATPSTGLQGSGAANSLGASGGSAAGLARSSGSSAFTPPSQELALMGVLTPSSAETHRRRSGLATSASDPRLEPPSLLVQDVSPASSHHHSRPEASSVRDVSPRQLRDTSPRHVHREALSHTVPRHVPDASDHRKRLEATWAGSSQPMLQRSSRSEPLRQQRLERSSRSELLGQALRDNFPSVPSHAGSSQNGSLHGSHTPPKSATMPMSGIGRSEAGPRRSTHLGHALTMGADAATQLNQRRLLSADPLPMSVSAEAGLRNFEFDAATNAVDLGGSFEMPSGPPSLPSDISSPNSQTPRSHRSRSYSQATSGWMGEVPSLVVRGPVDLEAPVESDLGRRQPQHDHLLKLPGQRVNDDASSVSSASSIAPGSTSGVANLGSLAPALTPQGEAAQRDRVSTHEVFSQRWALDPSSRPRSLSHVPTFSTASGPRLDVLASKTYPSEAATSSVSPARRSSMPEHHSRVGNNPLGAGAFSGEHASHTQPSKLFDVDLTGDSPGRARESRSGSEAMVEVVLEGALEINKHSVCSRCGQTWAIPEPYGGECPDCHIQVDVVEFGLPTNSQRHSQELLSSALHLQAERAREHQSLAGSSAVEGSGLTAVSSEVGSDGLTQALSAFGAPSEWWHDSIILGRLSALALRYFAAKGARKLWQAWCACVRESTRKNEDAIRHRTCLAIRLKATAWRGWLATLARFGRKIEGFQKLQSVIQRKLRPSWARLQQAVFLRRDISRRLRLLYLIERKMLHMLARAHYYQRLLRLGFAGLWLATQVPIAGPKQFGSHSITQQQPGVSSQAPLGHVSQVIRRVWRRWSFATQMWLSSTEYNMRQTEAWLSGEITTPRSIVTSNVLEVISPGAQNLGPSGLSQGFLGYGGRWRFDGVAGSTSGVAADPVSPDQASMNFEDPQTPLLELPFVTGDMDVKDSTVSSPSCSSPARNAVKRAMANSFTAEADPPSLTFEYDNGPVYLSAQTPTLQGSTSNLQARVARMRPPRQKPLRKTSEELALPPNRTRRSHIFRAAEEASVPRGRQHAEAVALRGLQDTDVTLTEGLSPRGDINFSAADDVVTSDAVHDSISGMPIGSGSLPSTRIRDSLRSEQDVMEFVDPEASPVDESGDFSFTRVPGQAPTTVSGPSFLQRPQSKVDPLLMQDSAGDYWSVRSRFGPASAVRPVALRQRC